MYIYIHVHMYICILYWVFMYTCIHTYTGTYIAPVCIMILCTLIAVYLTCSHLRRNVPMSVGASASKNYYPSSGGSGVRKDILSPVPETYSGARVVDMTIGPPMSPSSVVSSTVTSQGGAPRSGFSGRNWAGARSMEGLHHTPPQSRREAPPYRYMYCYMYMYMYCTCIYL